MCGIIGYIGNRTALNILMNGLHRMEYRGYDSAGVGLQLTEQKEIRVIRAKGKVADLDRILDQVNTDEIHESLVGIAHTRWATHGEPCIKNAHPHVDCHGDIAIVHNGVIENHSELCSDLLLRGHVFASETDTEVLAHLIEDARKKCDSIVGAVRIALTKVRGAYGIAVLSKKDPDMIVAARMGSPLLMGVTNDSLLVASDAAAILGHASQIIHLDDGEIAVLKKDGEYQVTSSDNRRVSKVSEILDMSVEDIQKGDHPHFMMKEMMEQPETVQSTIRGRLDEKDGDVVLGGLRDVADRLRTIDRLIIVACGSAYYAGKLGEYMIEGLAGVPVEVELASEFRYRDPIISENTVVLAISQSGETQDTLEAIREAKRKGALTLGIVNVVGSSIARETDAGVYNHAGPEIGVASTKAFISQCVVLAMLTVFLGRQRRMSLSMGQEIVESLKSIPEKVDELLRPQKLDEYDKLAFAYSSVETMLFMGRKFSLPVAFEGALKVKEITYVHAEAYAAGELKHGPIALVDKRTPSVVICPKDSVYDKTKIALSEIKARGGSIICITSKGDEEIHKLANHVIQIPRTIEMLTPILAVIPLQFFSYYLAVLKGLDPDKPRNLAKSVTVE